MIPAVLAALAVWSAVPVSPRVRARRLFVADVSTQRPDAAWTAALLVPVAGFVVLGGALGVLVGVALAPIVHRQVSSLDGAAERRRQMQMSGSLPGALDLMAAALETGQPPGAAFALVADATADPLGTELALIASRLDVVSDPDLVWAAVAQHPVLGPVGRAFRRASTSGMPIAGVVTAVADEVRNARAAHLREHSRKIAVRTAAPLGVCFLPAFFLIGIVPTLVATFSSLSW